MPTFQLGEMGGTGEHLLAAAREVLAEGHISPDYVESLGFFVAEEQEHARLLAMVCDQLDIPLIDGHWTDRIFQAARKRAGLRCEVLILLAAEMMGLGFYGVLASGLDDPNLARLFSRIEADERRHLNFHAGTIPDQLDRWTRPRWLLARTVWTGVLVGSAAVVAWDHRRTLRACGSGVRTFFTDMVSTIRIEVPRVFRS